jgi:hypothetical protein
MANTFFKIASVTVGGGGAASITFSGIPQTGYTDLVVKCSARGAFTGGPNDQLAVQFNGNTSNYSYKQIYGTGSAAFSQGASSYPDSYIASNAATANTFGSTDIYIPNYTTSNNKSVSIDSTGENNATAAAMSLTAGLWANTAAITSVTITNTLSGDFLSGSTFYLYGISKS